MEPNFEIYSRNKGFPLAFMILRNPVWKLSSYIMTIIQIYEMLQALSKAGSVLRFCLA